MFDPEVIGFCLLILAESFLACELVDAIEAKNHKLVGLDILTMIILVVAYALLR